MAAEIYLHLGMEGHAETALLGGLATVMRDETTSPHNIAFYRVYARLCIAQNDPTSAGIYFKKAILCGGGAGGNIKKTSIAPHHHYHRQQQHDYSYEMAQACLEYGIFLLESSCSSSSSSSSSPAQLVLNMMEAERSFRRGINVITR